MQAAAVYTNIFYCEVSYFYQMLRSRYLINKY